MHVYAADRTWWGEVCVFGFTALVVWLLDYASSLIEFDPDWWATLTSFGAVYVAVRWIAVRYAWRVTYLRSLGIVGVPDLNGEWQGYVRSSATEFKDTHNATLRIAQQWSTISVTLETEQSHSWSTSAILRSQGVECAELTYTYVNEPKAHAGSTMHAHRGTATLKLDGSSLEGEYYTGRDREAYGTIKVNRLERSAQAEN